MLSLNEKGQEINIFFCKENLNLIGWQTEDIYQNLTVTYIYDVKNKKIDNKRFLNYPNYKLSRNLYFLFFENFHSSELNNF